MNSKLNSSCALVNVCSTSSRLSDRHHAATNSKLRRLPNAPAALASVVSVRLVYLPSSGRLSAARLVCMRYAMAVLVRRWACICSSICYAINYLMAAAVVISKMFVFKKLSNLLQMDMTFAFL